MIRHRIAFLNGSLRKDSFHGRLGLVIGSCDESVLMELY